jgi:hypothetical protein
MLWMFQPQAASSIALSVAGNASNTALFIGRSATDAG